jgi:nitrile hydratase beta subunit-like protein
MNGVHDLGGMHGMGPINPEPNEPVFHAPWERTVFGLFIATFAGGHFNVDQFRHAIEKMDAAHYLQSPYYEHWLHAMQSMLIDSKVLTEAEINERMTQLKEAA